MMTHPDQEEPIYEHQREINEMWNALTAKVSLCSHFTVKLHKKLLYEKIWIIF